MSTGPRLEILYTSATAAGNHDAGIECEFLGMAAEGRKRFDDGLVDSLRGGAWLNGDSWRRGGYLTTHGLRAADDHPELALINVPGAFAPMAHQLLNEIGEYVLRSGKRLDSGEVFELTHPRFPQMVVTFARLAPGELSAPEFTREMLLVVPLP